MSKKTISFEELDKKTQNEIEEKVGLEGLDTAALKEMSFVVDQELRTMSLKYQGFEITLPAPSQGVIDSIFEEHGGTLLAVAMGSILALASAAVGAALKD